MQDKHMPKKEGKKIQTNMEIKTMSQIDLLIVVLNT